MINYYYDYYYYYYYLALIHHGNIQMFWDFNKL